MTILKNLEELIEIVRQRKNSPVDKSYTNKLLTDKKLVVSKVKEEISELLEAVEKKKLIQFTRLLTCCII